MLSRKKVRNISRRKILLIKFHLLQELTWKPYAMDKFCRAHYANHSEKSCQEFMNLFKEIILPWEFQDEEYGEEEEEEE